MDVVLRRIEVLHVQLHLSDDTVFFETLFGHGVNRLIWFSFGHHSYWLVGGVLLWCLYGHALSLLPVFFLVDLSYLLTVIDLLPLKFSLILEHKFFIRQHIFILFFDLFLFVSLLDRPKNLLSNLEALAVWLLNSTLVGQNVQVNLHFDGRNLLREDDQFLKE